MPRGNLFFNDYHCRRAIVHDFGVICADKAAFYAVACGAVDSVAINFAIAIHHSVFTREELVLGVNVESVRLMPSGAKFTAEVFAIDEKTQLICVIGIVSHTIIEVVVGDACASAERDLPSEVGEKVESVMMMMLRYCQVAVQYHPVNQIGQLTQTATDALRSFSSRDCEAVFIALPLGGSAHKFPKRKSLARANYQAIDVSDRQCEVCRLVLLQLHIDVA